MEFGIFKKKLIRNYILGSTMSVCIVGSTLIFYTLDLTIKEGWTLFCILVLSLASMLFFEFISFRSHLNPIKKVFDTRFPKLTDIEDAYLRTHYFPVLTFKRIMFPHLLSLAVPASIMTGLLISVEVLSFAYYYIGLAWIGAILVASMHGMIEFYLTTKAIQPILKSINEKAIENYNFNLSLNGKVLLPIRKKFFISALFIGVFPVSLFALATQIRLYQSGISIQDYWSWAGIITILTIIFAVFGSLLFTQDVEQPIDKLVKGMKLVQSGDLKTIEDYYSDEFSEVMLGFNHMINSIKEREEMNTQLLESFFTVLAAALDARDPYTAGHSIRVANYSVEIGKKAGLSKNKIALLKKSALLHDIGKIGISDKVLLKEGRLSEEEYEQVKLHPVIGAKILEEINPKNAMQELLPGVKYHHERYDGRGYPEGLSKENIPLFGRILAVADAFDAMTSDRPYRKGMPIEKALTILTEGEGAQWDPKFTQLFVEYIEENKTNEELQNL